MVKWFSVGVEAEGVIAIGQVATGVIAIGQIATGVVAVGQLARGGLVVGQLAIGVVTLGQLSLGVAKAAGMVGIGGRASFGLILPLLPGRAAPFPSPQPPISVWRLAVFVALFVLWFLAAGVPVWQEVFAPGGVFDRPRVLR